jgi:hypothetical protein
MSDADPGTTAATEQAQRFREASDKLRERSDTAAKGLAALGTAGLTAVGIAKFSDIYPFPPGEWEAVVAVVAGFIAMVVALVAFTLRLWDANRPLVTRIRATEMSDDDEERDEIQAIYERLARLNGVDTLAGYEARGHRLERIADRTGNDQRAARLRKRADQIRAEILATQARAALVVIRQRVNGALKGGGAASFALLFAGGLLAFGFGADRLDSERSARVAAYKACADAMTAKVRAQKLPSICDDVTQSTADETPTVEQTRAQRMEALSAAHSACVDTAVEEEQPASMCDGIREQLVSVAR